jgi:thymidylate kinase
VARRTSEIEIGSSAPETLKILAGSLDDRLSYCVLHGWPVQPKYPPSDLDIAIIPNELAELEATLSNTSGARIVQLLQHETTCYYFVLATRREGVSSLSALDVAADYRLDGHVFFTAKDLLWHRRRLDGLWVAAPEVEFAYLLVKKISKGSLPEHQRVRVRRLFELLGDEARVILHRLLGARCGSQVVDALIRSDWVILEARLARLRRALRLGVIKRDPFNPIRYWGPEIYRRWRRWCQPTGLCVAVLGPDGAGKSTLIQHLKLNLGEAAFRQTSIFHLRPRLGHGNESHNRVTDPHRMPPRPPWLSLLKISYYALLYSVGYLFVVYPRLVRSTLVLFDRYYDDLFVDPRRYRYGASMRYARIGRCFARRPDLYFVLDVPEELLISRKQEVSRSELSRQRDAYRRLTIDLPNAVMLDGSSSPGEVAQSAGDVIIDYLHERYTNRRRRWSRHGDSEKTLQWLTTSLCSSPDTARFGFCNGSRDHLTSRWSIVREFGWLSLGDGRAYLIPLGANRVARKALDLYNAQSPRANFVKALLAAGLTAGIGKRLMPTVRLTARRTSTGREDASASILEYLTNVLGRSDLSFGISAGTPGPHRKPVLLVLSGDGQALAYVKVGSNRVSNTLLQHEVRTLQFLASHPCQSFSAPSVLYSGWWNGRYLVIQSAPKQHMTAAVGDRRLRYFDIPKELATLHTRWMSLKESGFWEGILLRIHEVENKYYRETLERAVRRADDWLKAERLPFHFSHGDFAPWNTKYNGEKLYVFDWEYATETGSPAQDVFHFHFQEMRYLERRNPERIYAAFLRDSVPRTQVETHLAGLSLKGTPLEHLFFLYRLDQLTREAAGPQTGEPLLREFASFGNLLNLV